MKIKVKVKTLILSSLIVLFCIFGIVPFANIELANYFSSSKPEIAEKLYDYYLRYPIALRKDEALYKSAQSTMNGFTRYNIMMGMQLGEKTLDYTTINNTIDKYKNIIRDYPKSDYYTLAYKGILDSYIYLGDSDNLKKWIDWGKLQDYKKTKDISVLYEGYNYFANREYNKAEELLSTFVLGNNDIDYIYYFLKGHIEFAKEDFNKALEYYNKASEIGWQYRTGFFGSVVPDGRRFWLDELDFYKGENKIKGRVTADGVGIPFVEIYLQYPNQGYASRGIDFVAITDKDGYYETIGIKEGRYDLGIGIGTAVFFNKAYLTKNVYNLQVSDNVEFDFEFKTPMKVISPKPEEIVEGNKFEVKWEEVNEADYYTVRAVAIDEGSSMTVSIRDENGKNKIKGNKAVFNIEMLKNSPTGYSMDDDEIVNPEAIMGYIHGETMIPIIVNAYDKNGNMLSSSVPMTSRYENVPSIKIVGKLTVGEKLIVNKEYEKAVGYYENLLLEDKDNIEALSYLSKLYIFGWGKGTKDVHKAIDCGTKVYNLSGNADVILRVLGQMNSNDYRDNKEIIKELFDIIPNEYRDIYFYWYRGEYYRALGEFEKAREDFLFTDNIFLSDIIYIDLYYGKYERAIDFLRNNNVKFYYMNKGKLIEGIELLSKLPQDDKEYIIFREYLFRILKREGDYNHRKEDFDKVYNSIKNLGIKIILNEIKIDNNW
ncbi:carboxypeptidase-like regulatory domain-containing protein [Tissierella praeacuta]|uniref:carboxypeptidase-like regulatory domain-containing protein n=1 Tax=Tissierella praeacuta TaxID=43131 RepID=UPI001C101409|nr:carboxypeptidase-like regulatory domain-containing protein [Tissierella praeacuta]MBU5257505.1 carboxypeptidase-like regulatory domain-containing protein [Tissierella praeacuta]